MKKQKLRYYLRGLGIGVLVTAFVLGIADKDNGTMTDEQVRARALELGMVDSGSIMLSDLKDNSEQDAQEPSATLEILEETESVESSEEAQETEIAASSESEEIQETETADAPESVEIQEIEGIDSTEEADETEVVESVESMEEPQEESQEEPQEEPESVTLTIRSGASSYSVSKDLVALGLVEDAGEYDKYLCDYGYSRTIRVGTYEIPRDADKEEIAKIITGKR